MFERGHKVDQMTPSPAYPGSSFVALLCTFLLIFSILTDQARPAAETSAGTDGESNEQKRLYGFVDALHMEGSVTHIKQCKTYSMCIYVTEQFVEFSHREKQSVAGLLHRIFRSATDGGAPVLSIRFFQANSETELGIFQEGRLFWSPSLPPIEGKERSST